jgi:hypothetical protein
MGTHFGVLSGAINGVPNHNKKTKSLNHVHTLR